MSDDPFGDTLDQAKASGINIAPVTATNQPPPDDPFASALEAAKNATPEEQKDQGPVPEWSEIPGQAKAHALESAKNLGSNIYHAAIHPIETAENLGSVGLGYMEKAGKNIGLPSGQGYEQYADAVNKMVMDRYGSMDNFKRTLATDPVGAAADLSAVLTGVGGLAKAVPGIATAGKVAGAIGSAIDPLNVIAKPVMSVAKGTTALAREAFGHATGAGPEALSAAAEAGFKAPMTPWTNPAGRETAETFRGNLRGQVPIEEPVNQATTAIDNIIAGKNANYNSGITQAGLNQPISPTSFAKIADGIRKAGQIDKFDTIPSVLQANEGVSNLVSKFLADPSKHTVEGLDSLKQAVGEYNVTHGLAGTKAGQVANTYYDAIKDAIVQQAPGYAKVMDRYAEDKALLNQIQKAFSLPPNERKLVIDTALRKLQSTMRNNANTNWGYRAGLLDVLKENGAPNIGYALAGQALSSKAPRGLAKISAAIGSEVGAGLIALFTGHPGIAFGALKSALVTAAASSPRVVGEAAYYAGRATKPVSKVLNRPVARVLNQAGRIDQLPEMQARGGAVSRALRTARRGS